MIGRAEIADAILETLPVEITVLDENDRIIGWNTRQAADLRAPGRSARPGRARVPLGEEPRHARDGCSAR